MIGMSAEKKKRQHLRWNQRFGKARSSARRKLAGAGIQRWR